MLPSAIRLGDLRRNTLSWCRMTRISACSAIRDRTRPTTAHQIKLHKSLIATILSRFAGDRHQGWVCGRDSGEYWAIQAKFRSERDTPLNRRELGTFTSLAFNTCDNISQAVVAHTCTKPVSKRHLMRNTVEIGYDRWKALDDMGQNRRSCSTHQRRSLSQCEAILQLGPVHTPGNRM